MWTPSTISLQSLKHCVQSWMYKSIYNRRGVSYYAMIHVIIPYIHIIFTNIYSLLSDTHRYSDLLPTCTHVNYNMKWENVLRGHVDAIIAPWVLQDLCACDYKLSHWTPQHSAQSYKAKNRLNTMLENKVGLDLWCLCECHFNKTGEQLLIITLPRIDTMNHYEPTKYLSHLKLVVTSSSNYSIQERVHYFAWRWTWVQVLIKIVGGNVLGLCVDSKMQVCPDISAEGYESYMYKEAIQYGQSRIAKNESSMHSFSNEAWLSVVHKQGQVVTELGRRNVWDTTSAEKKKMYYSHMCFYIWEYIAVFKVVKESKSLIK